MNTEDQIDKNLKKIRAEDRQKTKRVMRKIGLVLVILSVAMAAIFMYVFYVSPKQIVDIVVISVAIISSAVIFFLGLVRVFG